MDEGSTPAPASSPPVPEPKGGVPKAVWVIAAAIVVAGIAVAGAVVLTNRQTGESRSDEPPPKRTYALAGSLTAPECGGGYDLENASVEIRDQTDKLIGSTATGFNESYADDCLVKFETQVPKASFYQVTIGTHGGPSYSFAEMEANNWQLDLSLD